MGRFASLLTGKSVEPLDEDLNLTPAMMAPGAAMRERQRKLRLGLLGKKERKSVKENLIPSNAERILGKSDSDNCNDEPEMPDTPDAEGLFPVACALIAPDIMPDLYKPLSPAKIPTAPAAGNRLDAAKPPATSTPPGESAIDTLLNRGQNEPVQPATSATATNVESLLRSMGTGFEDLPVAMPAPSMRERPLQETLYNPKVAAVSAPSLDLSALHAQLGLGNGASVAAATVPGIAMPPPATGNAAKVCDVTRSYRS